MVSRRNKNLYTKNLPTSFFKQVSKGLDKLPFQDYIRKLLKNILGEFNGSKQYVTTTSNILLSRCVPVSKIIRMRLRTCGSLSAVAASCLRKLNYQTRLINGKVLSKGRWRSHAWIEVYDPSLKRWQAYDIFGKDFKIRSKRKRLKAYDDWSELEPLLRKRSNCN